ncbi:sigma-70 family RNA polymerase sigma factor [Microlunatus panaciterrae]|uniref:RNA polymerase sigma factor n=1 Tax=Microlunatus panaciterrae TaxID=400768 RepID=A0ABS2RKW0_9ACTN|nr:sigma-70 family RNA polymerase sigma factor [Microlunatus panaciterrae]MBM7799637.1 RNA polymerase sigma-70 factor (ECF subfamily) [Microlunatus panaciterrae]
MTQDGLSVVPSGELVAEAKAGDRTAIDLLIGLVRPLIYRYCRSRLASYAGGLDIADDVAQETCMAVYRVLPWYEDRGVPFASWLYAIASHKVADAQRSYLRSPTLLDELPEVAEPSPTPEERLIAAANAGIVLDLVDQLPEKMRNVVMLRTGGATAEETAVMLGMSAGAVRVTHHRALTKLRALAHQAGAVPDPSVDGSDLLETAS